jgi:hypothetical protein
MRWSAFLLVAGMMASLAIGQNLQAQLTCTSPGNGKVVVTALNFAATGVTVVLQSGTFVGTAPNIPAGTSVTFTTTFSTMLTTVGPAIVSAHQNNLAVTALSNIATCPTTVPPNPQITFSQSCNTPGTGSGKACVIVTATNTGNVPFTQFTFLLSDLVQAASVTPVALPVGSSTSVSHCYTVGTTPSTYSFTATFVGTYGPASSPSTKTFTKTLTCPNPFFVPTTFLPLTLVENCFINSVAANGLKSITFTATITNPNPTAVTQVVIIKRLDPINHPTAVQNFQVASIPANGVTTISGNYQSAASTNAFELHYLDSSGNQHTQNFNGATCIALG